jgi:hypothetical protein
VEDQHRNFVDDVARLRWNVRRRLKFIELRLYWEGRMNRGDLVDFFSISVPQASQDLALYQELAPGNLLYDKTARTYVAGPDFRPLLSEPSADGYLAQLRSLATGALERSDTWIGRPPAFAGAPRLRRVYDREVLRKLVACIHRKRDVRVRYLSFSDDVPSARTIAPHALGFDGQRWHVRAFCHRSASFRDFVIGRLSHLNVLERTKAEEDWDLEWTRQVVLCLQPNPRLSAQMKAALERDHGMRDGALHVTTTVCSSYYLQSQLDLDIDPALLPPQRLQLVLTNRSEVARAREEAKVEAAELIRAAGMQATG